MKAWLNVSLDEQLCAGPIDQRHRLVMAAMRLCFHGVTGEIQAVTYDGPDGTVREHCAVICVAIEQRRRQEFEAAVDYLSRQFNQDCIALMYESGEGKCIGPGAERWPFDRNFFNMPAAARAEAA